MRLMVGLIVVGMRSAEDCYRKVRRYSAGVRFRDRARFGPLA